jgi:hypothetical protein
VTLSPADAQLVERTRSLVLNVLIADGAGIAASGLALRGRQAGASTWPLDEARALTYAALVALIFLSLATRRALASRARLRDPAARRARFAGAHLAGAVAGALAIPLGFAYAFAVRPTLDAVLPFWASALILGLLSLPRADALDGLDPLESHQAPTPAPSEPGPP